MTVMAPGVTPTLEAARFLADLDVKTSIKEDGLSDLAEHQKRLLAALGGHRAS